MTPAPAPPPAPPLEFRDDFEATPIGAPPAFAALRLEGKVDSIAVTAAAASRGQRSLKIQDAPGLAQTYNPHFYYQPYHSQGMTRVRFALRAEAGAVLYHEWRDNASPYRTGPSLTIQNGKLRIGGIDQMDLPADQWAEFEITSGLGAQATVRPRCSGSPCAIPGALSIGFVANDTKPVAFFLDDIELRHQPAVR